jgi:hypothetical protein
VDPDFFDDHLEQALAAFQQLAAVPVTKIIDSATVARMHEPRCGYPDGDIGADRIDKWARGHSSMRWNQTLIKYRIEGFSLMRTLAIAAGIEAWEETIDLDLCHSFAGLCPTASPAFTVVPHLLDPRFPNDAAQGSPLPNPAIGINMTRSWTDAELQNIATHEMGHVLGLGHSSLGTNFARPMMWPFLQGRTSLDDDDRIAANSWYNGWTIRAQHGVADIGANTGAEGSPEIVWAIHSNAVPRRWDDGSQSWISGPTNICASRIDVGPGGEPWIIRCDNRIARLVNDNWEEAPGGGLGKDIGVGRDGSVWIIGMGDDVWRFNGGGWEWNGNSSVRAIDVSPNGTPWVVKWNGHIEFLGSGWESDTNVTGGLAIDIGIGGRTGFDPREYIYVLGIGGGVWVKTRQPEFPLNCDPTAPRDMGGCDAIAQNHWEFVHPGGHFAGIAITASGRGRPWMVDERTGAWSRNELPQ